jgi:dihydrofolate reductase
VSALRAMIAAVSPEGVIGVDGGIPWRYAGDLRRFKRLTLGSAVIMGRATWESMGGRPLPGRRNVVITSHALPAVEHHPSLPAALAACTFEPVWLIGGARIYQEGMGLVDLIDLTYVPDHVDRADAVRFPPIDERVWEPGPLLPHEDEPALRRREYRRRAG